MATNYAEMEREFLAGLEADTGHDLAGWMARIDAQNLSKRNDIIDWLRTQRFTFSWASWLERIHHNGGQPIYGGAPRPVPSAPASPPRALTTEAAPPPTLEPAPVLVQTRPAPPVPQAPAAADALADLLAKAKAYRPLAEHLIREVRKALPDVVIGVREGYVSLARPAEFAALTVSARDLRLGLDLGEEAATVIAPRGHLAGTRAGISHVLILTDARQVGPPLLDALRQADRRVNGA